MGFLKYLVALWITAAVYALSSLFAGISGFPAYSQMLSGRDQQLSNLENLQNINKELERSVEALLKDPDTIRLHARELGYGAPGERFIRIVGLQPVRQNRSTTGRIVLPEDAEFVPDKTLRILSACVGAAVLVCLCFSDFLARRREESADSLPNEQP